MSRKKLKKKKTNVEVAMESALDELTSLVGGWIEKYQDVGLSGPQVLFAGLFVKRGSKEYVEGLEKCTDSMVYHPVAFRCGSTVDNLLLYEQMTGPLLKKVEALDSGNKDIDIKEFLAMDGPMQ